jgi:hypothetical protein
LQFAQADDLHLAAEAAVSPTSSAPVNTIVAVATPSVTAKWTRR